MRVLAALSLLLLSAAPVWAHGGTFRDPGSVPPGLRAPSDAEPPPPLPTDPCFCAKPDCKHCSPGHLLSGSKLELAEEKVRVTESFGDVVRVSAQVRFRARKDAGRIEAYRPLNLGSVMAVTSASIRVGQSTLHAVPAAASVANRKYLETRNRTLDPLLLTPRAPGLFDLRAFPVVADKVTVVTIRGISLAPRTPTRTRLYRTKSRIMAVVPLAGGDQAPGAALVDRIHHRAVYFVDLEAARKRFGGTTVFAARRIPGIPALEKAITAQERATWVALPKDVDLSAPSGDVPPPPAEP